MLGNFQNDVQKGKQAEDKFIEYLNKHNKKWVDVRNNQFARQRDVDFLVWSPKLNLWEEIEIKNNYKQDRKLIIEETEDLDKGSKGWWYYCKADYLIFSGTSEFVILKFCPQAKQMYENVKPIYPLIKNHFGTTVCHSAYRRVDLFYFHKWAEILKWGI